MNLSARVKIMTELSNRLAQEEWSVIDLLLREFGFRCTDQWNGTKNAYVLAMLQDGDEQKLAQLGQHFNLYQPDAPSNISFTSSSLKGLIQEVETQKTLMIAVSTGGPRIQSVNEEYKDRRLRIVEHLQLINIKDPNGFSDLWEWYGKWSDGSLQSYQSRRLFVNTMYQPLLDELLLQLKQPINVITIEPTGWTRVDRSVDKIVKSLAASKNEEDFQSIGLLCRETLISLAQAVHIPEKHDPIDEIRPSESDAKRKLESYIEATVSGNSNEELRKFVKSTYQLAVVLQHRRTATFQDAALCVEATRSLINVIAIISGHRNTA